MTYQIKKSYVHDIAEELTQYLLPSELFYNVVDEDDEEKIYLTAFVEKVYERLFVFENQFLEGIESRIDMFSLRIRHDQLPSYLKVN